MQMRLAALLVLALAVGCENRRGETETGAAEGDRTGVDTVVQSQTVKDTTVIRADTSIDVDTLEHTDHIKEKNR